ncbi:hypothetical protein CXP35_10045 [Komagataeibacter xylinus]|nr:hypothetical protein CXP35_10045 [Komagataeibacter xylinus]
MPPLMGHGMPQPAPYDTTWRDDYLLPAARKHEFLKVSFSQNFRACLENAVDESERFFGVSSEGCLKKSSPKNFIIAMG